MKPLVSSEECLKLVSEANTIAGLTAVTTIISKDEEVQDDEDLFLVSDYHLIESLSLKARDIILGQPTNSLAAFDETVNFFNNDCKILVKPFNSQHGRIWLAMMEQAAAIIRDIDPTILDKGIIFKDFINGLPKECFFDGDEEKVNNLTTAYNTKIAKINDFNLFRFIILSIEGDILKQSHMFRHMIIDEFKEPALTALYNSKIKPPEQQ